MTNDFAKQLKALHVPSAPIVFPNVWDIPSFKAVVSLNDGDSKPLKAIATASWAIAAALGIEDDDLTMEQNFEAIAKIALLCKAAELPLTADLQDGYGGHIAESVKKAIRLGVVGANIEDSIPTAGTMYDLDEQVRRYKTALEAAAEAGCPDFVLNARCDIFHLDTGLSEKDMVQEAITRGKAYLDAGATTVFYWGGSGRGLRTAWVETLVRELGGRVAVKLAVEPGTLTTAELAKIGVARISVGPSLFLVSNIAMKKAAASILNGGGLF
ncbi:phosphoenolpyruvate phosphomutase-domain-containing protein [Dactylonectria estremocensis]|uniref:Phosphoenolpyruvate phosphomutase-domain-containing protein n=1 Tax=Dactylonectria estremocensis TaxID=1079267 RepID=A0A9P9F4A8_9HYPO|nr:phosphoenolpyruvate phosphomutase-domain-containing protein [Dactylonectria estremocensis]